MDVERAPRAHRPAGRTPPPPRGAGTHRGAAHSGSHPAGHTGSHLSPARRTLRRAVGPLLTALLMGLVTGAALLGTTTTTSAAPVEHAVQLAPRPAPDLSTSAYEGQVQYWVNRERSRHGLRPLGYAPCTDQVAERWAAFLARHDAFYHQSMTRLLERCHAYYVGETLGRGTIGPRTLVRMWMDSPPHRHVLLSRNPRRIGIGAVPNLAGEWVVAANFMRF